MPRSDEEASSDVLTTATENTAEWVEAEDWGTYKDRARPGVVQARQTLGAVGRVASRVRTSGLLRVPSLLPKAKEEEEEVNSSPWGVGTAAISRSQSVSVLPDDLARMRSGASVAMAAKRKSDLLEVSSPLSTDDVCLNAKKESEPKRGVQSAVPEKESPKIPGFAALQSPQKRDSGKPGRPLEKLASNVVRPKFTFRPSLLVEAKIAGKDARNSQETLKKSSSETDLVSRKGLDKEGKGTKAIHENDTSVSSPVIAIGHENELEKSTQNNSNELQTDGVPDVNNSDIGRETDKSMRFLQFVPFARAMSRHERGNRKSRENYVKVRPMFALSRGRSQALDSSPRGRRQSPQANADQTKTSPQQFKELQLSRQQSSAPKTRRNILKGFFMPSQQTGDVAKEKTSRASIANKKHVKSKKSQAAVSPDFFAKAAANKNTNILKAPRTDQLVSKVLKSPNALRSRKKPQQHIDDTEENDLLASDDDEATDESVVRSLAVDDFITYQTKQTRKTQKGR